MAARRASDILASLRLSSLMSLVPALFLPPSTFSPRARFSALSPFVLYIYIEFYIPGLHLILFRVKLFTLFHAARVDAGGLRRPFSRTVRSRLRAYFALSSVPSVSITVLEEFDLGIVSGISLHFSLPFLVSLFALAMSETRARSKHESESATRAPRLYPERKKKKKNSRPWRATLLERKNSIKRDRIARWIALCAL